MLECEMVDQCDVNNNHNRLNESPVNHYLIVMGVKRLTDDDVSNFRNHLMETFRGLLRANEPSTEQSNRRISALTNLVADSEKFRTQGKFHGTIFVVLGKEASGSGARLSTTLEEPMVVELS